MSATIEGPAKELLKGKNFATSRRCARTARCRCRRYGSTCRTGSPVLNSAEGRAWPRNLERDPRVTLAVQNIENPYEYLEMRGRVAERTHEGADEHIDALAKKYLGIDELSDAPARRTARDHPRRARARKLPRRPRSRAGGSAPSELGAPSSRRHSDGGRGWLRSHSSRSGRLPRSRARAARRRCGRGGGGGCRLRARSAYAR